MQIKSISIYTPPFLYNIYKRAKSLLYAYGFIELYAFNRLSNSVSLINNDIILDFSRRHKKPHNCHMTEGKKDLWNVKDRSLTCYGSKLKEKETLE